MKYRYFLIILFLALPLAGAAEAKLYIVEMQNVILPMWQFASSSPAANQPVKTPPQSVMLNFSAAVNVPASSIAVYDPYGNKLQTGPLTSTGTSISVTMPQLPEGNSGAYRVDWKAACQCTDTTMLNGSFFFSIQ